MFTLSSHSLPAVDVNISPCARLKSKPVPKLPVRDYKGKNKVTITGFTSSVSLCRFHCSRRLKALKAHLSHQPYEDIVERRVDVFDAQISRALSFKSVLLQWSNTGV